MGMVDRYKRACELAELYGRALANLESNPFVWDNYDDQDLRQFTEDAARDLEWLRAKPSVWGADGIKQSALVYQRYLNESHRRALLFAEKLNEGPREKSE